MPARLTRHRRARERITRVRLQRRVAFGLAVQGRTPPAAPRTRTLHRSLVPSLLRRAVARVKRHLPVPAYLVEQFEALDRRLWVMDRRLRYLQEAVGRAEARQLAAAGGTAGDTAGDATGLAAREFRVYSQWGEDGIIDHLVRHVRVPRKLFVEFGVEGYDEANTRFLMINHNWAGLVIDGSAWGIAHLRRSQEYWLYNLKAVQAFVTAENINQLLAEHGATGEIGLLSIDIDGMDYWVWKAIDVVSPAIVVVEYNHRFGSADAVTVPYDSRFDRWKAHHSILYYGASLRAMVQLGAEKGYAFVGCGSAGLNAFFVRRDLLPPEIPERTVEEGFVAGQFCEAHDEQGRRVKTTPEEESRLARQLPLVHVGAGTTRAG